MKDIMTWEEFSSTGAYKNAPADIKAQYRDGWYSDHLENRKESGEEIDDDDYQRFISYVNKKEANEKIHKERGLLDEFSDLVTHAGIGLLKENSLISAPIKRSMAVNLVMQGMSPEEANESVERVYSEMPKPENRSQRVSSFIGSSLGDIITMPSMTVPIAGGTSRLLTKIPALLRHSKGPLIHRMVTGGVSNIGTMGLSEGLKAAVDDEEETPIMGRTREGLKVGTVASLIDTPLEIAKAAVPKKYKSITDIGLDTLGVFSQAGGMTALQGGDTEEFIQNALNFGTLKAAHIPAKIKMTGEEMRRKKYNVEKLHEVSAVLPDYVNGAIANDISKIPYDPSKLKETTERIVDSFVDNIAKTTNLTEETILQHIQDTGAPKEAYEVYMRHSDKSQKEVLKRNISNYKKEIGIGDAKKEVDFVGAVQDILENTYSRQQLDHLEKYHVYHAIGEILKEHERGLITDISKNGELAEVAGGQYRKRLKSKINNANIELGQYRRMIDALSQDKDYKLGDPSINWASYDFSKFGDDVEGATWAEHKSMDTIKNAIGNGWLTRFSEVVKNQSANGAKLMEIKKAKDLEADMLAGPWLSVADQLKDLSKEHREAIRQYIINKSKLSKFNEYVDKNKFRPDEVESISKIAENIIRTNNHVASVIQGMDVSGFKFLDDYFPQVIKQDVLNSPKKHEELIRELMNDGRIYEKMGDKVVIKKNGEIVREVEATAIDGRKIKTYQEYTAEQRYQRIKNYLAEYKQNRERLYGHIQMERMLEIPDNYLETDIYAVLSEYYQRTANRLAEIKHYGAKDQIINDALIKANMELAKNPQVSKEQHLESMQNLQLAAKLMTYQKGESPFSSKAIDAWLALNVLRKMPLSTIGQTGQFFAPIIRAGTPKHWAKALKARSEGIKFYNPETGKIEKISMRDLAIQAGSANSMIMNDMLANFTGEANTLLQTGGRKMLDIIGFKEMDFQNRMQAAATGWFYADDLIKRINKILSSETARTMDTPALMNLMQKKSLFKQKMKDRFAKRRLEQLDINLEEVLSRGRGEDGKFYLTKGELLRAARKFEIDTNFRASRFDLPKEFTKTGYGKAITQFNSYNFSRTVEIRDFVLKEAKQGNMGPIIWLAIMGGAVGTGIEGLRTIISGKELPESAFDLYMSALANFGAFGYASNIYAIGEYGSTNMGATADDVRKFANMIQATVHKNENKLGPITKFFLKEMPVVNPITRRMLKEQEKYELVEKQYKKINRGRTRKARSTRR